MKFKILLSLLLLVLLGCCHGAIPKLNLQLNQLEEPEQAVEVAVDPQPKEVVPNPEVVNNPGVDEAPLHTDPLAVLATETTNLITDKIDAAATGNFLFPGPIPVPVPVPAGPGVFPIPVPLPFPVPVPGNHDPFGDAARAVGGLAVASGTLAKGAIHLHSKLVAPLFGLGAKITAPLVKLNAKLAAPLIFAGASLAKPFAKGAVKLAAPTIKLGQIATKGFAPIGGPFFKGFNEAFLPIREANQPLVDAFQPINDAAEAVFGKIDFSEELDNTGVQSDVDRLAQDAGRVFEEAIGLKNAGIRAAQEAAGSAVRGATNFINTQVDDANKKNLRVRRMTSEEQDEFSEANLNARVAQDFPGQMVFFAQNNNQLSDQGFAQNSQIAAQASSGFRPLSRRARRFWGRFWRRCLIGFQTDFFRFPRYLRFRCFWFLSLRNSGRFPRDTSGVDPNNMDEGETDEEDEDEVDEEEMIMEMDGDENNGDEVQSMGMVDGGGSSRRRKRATQGGDSNNMDEGEPDDEDEDEVDEEEMIMEMDGDDNIGDVDIQTMGMNGGGSSRRRKRAPKVNCDDVDNEEEECMIKDEEENGEEDGEDMDNSGASPKSRRRRAIHVVEEDEGGEDEEQDEEQDEDMGNGPKSRRRRAPPRQEHDDGEAFVEEEVDEDHIPFQIIDDLQIQPVPFFPEHPTFPPRETTGTCEAFRSRLVTSECHREEEYRTKTCSRLDCSALNVAAIHRRCQVSAPGVHCEQNCYTYQEHGDTCFSCNFRFTRALSTTGKCASLNDCLFGSRICPRSSISPRPFETTDDMITLQFFQQQQQEQQQLQQQELTNTVVNNVESRRRR